MGLGIQLVSDKTDFSSYELALKESVSRLVLALMDNGKVDKAEKITAFYGEVKEVLK